MSILKKGEVFLSFFFSMLIPLKGRKQYKILLNFQGKIWIKADCARNTEYFIKRILALVEAPASNCIMCSAEVLYN